MFLFLSCYSSIYFGFVIFAHLCSILFLLLRNRVIILVTYSVVIILLWLKYFIFLQCYIIRYTPYTKFFSFLFLVHNYVLCSINTIMQILAITIVCTNRLFLLDFLVFFSVMVFNLLCSTHINLSYNIVFYIHLNCIAVLKIFFVTNYCKKWCCPLGNKYYRRRVVNAFQRTKLRNISSFSITTKFQPIFAFPVCYGRTICWMELIFGVRSVIKI